MREPEQTPQQVDLHPVPSVVRRFLLARVENQLGVDLCEMRAKPNLVQVPWRLEVQLRVLVPKSGGKTGGPPTIPHATGENRCHSNSSGSFAFRNSLCLASRPGYVTLGSSISLRIWVSQLQEDVEPRPTDQALVFCLELLWRSLRGSRPQHTRCFNSSSELAWRLQARHSLAWRRFASRAHATRQHSTRAMTNTRGQSFTQRAPDDECRCVGDHVQCTSKNTNTNTGSTA